MGLSDMAYTQPMINYSAIGDILTVKEFKSICLELPFLFNFDWGDAYPIKENLIDFDCAIHGDTLHHIPPDAEAIIWLNK